eukprot:8904037-Lingulodinium_polyedra.AAC.1
MKPRVPRSSLERPTSSGRYQFAWLKRRSARRSLAMLYSFLVRIMHAGMSHWRSRCAIQLAR